MIVKQCAHPKQGKLTVANLNVLKVFSSLRYRERKGKRPYLTLLGQELRPAAPYQRHYYNHSYEGYGENRGLRWRTAVLKLEDEKIARMEKNRRWWGEIGERGMHEKQINNDITTHGYKNIHRQYVY